MAQIVGKSSLTNADREKDSILAIRQLEKRIRQLNREIDTSFNSRHNEYIDLYNELSTDKNDYERAFEAEKYRIRQQLSRISQAIRSFSKDIKHIKPDLNIVNKISATIEEIEQTIYTFKEATRMKYEELIAEERLLSNEVQALNDKIDLWSSQKYQRSESAQPQSARRIETLSAKTTTSNLLPEIVDFDRFLLETGGLTGGWDDYDHGTFMRIRNKYKGQPKFIDDLIGFLPTRTRDQINEHEKWYQNYNILGAKRREALRQWREQKEHAKEAILNDAEKVHHSQKEYDEAKQRQLQEEKERERVEKLQKVHAWKLERETKQRQLEEEEQRELDRKRLIEEKRLAGKEEQKKYVETIKRERDEYERNAREQEAKQQRFEQDLRKKVATMEIKKFRQRDMENLEEKLNRERLQREQEQEKQRRLESIKEHVNIHYDPQNLYEPTSAWKQRLDTPRENNNTSSGSKQYPQ
ncbi:unnamed protein product, partial [Didymodactylos carnosus]